VRRSRRLGFGGPLRSSYLASRALVLLSPPPLPFPRGGLSLKPSSDSLSASVPMIMI